MVAWSRTISSAAVNAAIKSLVAGLETEMRELVPSSGRTWKGGYDEEVDPLTE